MREFLKKIRPIFAKYQEEEHDMIMCEIRPACWRPRLWVICVWTIVGFAALFLLNRL